MNTIDTIITYGAFMGGMAMVSFGIAIVVALASYKLKITNHFLTCVAVGFIALWVTMVLWHHFGTKALLSLSFVVGLSNVPYALCGIGVVLIALSFIYIFKGGQAKPSI